MSAADWTPAWLWLAVIASGLYHGVNPGMGWPLAVSAGLMERSPRALVAALGPLTIMAAHSQTDVASSPVIHTDG